MVAEVASQVNNLLDTVYPNQSVTFVWILIRTKIRIYSCQENDTNEYPNIFVSKFNTNEYPNKYLDQKYSNIRIYLSLSGLD